MMDQLIASIVAKVGIPEPLAQKAVGMILGYMQRAGDDGAVASMITSMPGAAEMVAKFGGEEAAADAPTSGGGVMGGLMGAASKLMGGGDSGGMMQIGQTLMAEGLSMDQIKSVAQETLAHAEQHAGADTVEQVKKSIPGIGSFL